MLKFLPDTYESDRSDKSDGSRTPLSSDLTRQQRRALKRRMAKHPERYQTAS